MTCRRRSTIISLCRAHADLARAVRQDPGDHPAAATLAVLETEILRLAQGAQPFDSPHHYGDLAATLAPAIVSLIPDGHRFRLPREGYRCLAEAEPAILACLARKGLLLPSEEEGLALLLGRLLYRVREDRAAWRGPALALLSGDAAFLTTALALCRGTGTDPDLSVFLAEAIREIVRRDPGRGWVAMRGAIVGAASFDVGALLLAGIVPQDSGIDLRTRGRVSALLKACRSAHGRLAFLAGHGPLETYLARGAAPDLRDAA